MIRLLESQQRYTLDDFKLTRSKDTETEGEPVTLKWWNGKELVGEILVDTVPAIDGYRWFGTFEVNPKYRGHGLGTQILKYTMDKYKAGALGVRTDNEIALGLYKKMGFKIKGDTYTQDDGEYYRMYYKPNIDKSAVKER